MKRTIFAVWVVLCLALGACSRQSMIDRLEPKAESAAARALIDQLRQGDIEAVRTQLAPQYQVPDIAAKLREVVAIFPAGQPLSVKTVGTYVSTFIPRGDASQSTTTFNLTYEYEFQDAWVVANVVLTRRDGKLLIEGLHANRLAESLEASHALTLKGKSAVHWLIALLACAEALFCLYAFVLCLRTPIPRRKWLWALFTLVGVGSLQFNWTSGAFGVLPLSVQFLLGVSAVAAPYSPWILSVSIPLGAICFLARRRHWQAAAATPPLPT